jgi:hypothetical protein
VVCSNEVTKVSNHITEASICSIQNRPANQTVFQAWLTKLLSVSITIRLPGMSHWSMELVGIEMRGSEIALKAGFYRMLN